VCFKVSDTGLVVANLLAESSARSSKGTGSEELVETCKERPNAYGLVLIRRALGTKGSVGEDSSVATLLCAPLCL